MEGVRILALNGALASAVVINDVGLANWLVDYVPTVVFRQVFGGSDPSPIITGNETQDREAARGWYHEDRLHYPTTLCRKEVFIQLANEQSISWDGFFYDELMIQAEVEGRRLVCHNDSGGSFGDAFGKRALWYAGDWQTNEPHSDLIQGRLLAIDREFRNGHLYGWHSYGDITDGKYHRSDEIGAWPWFAGRGFEYMRLIDPQRRPRTLITEHGSGATQFTEELGFDEWWSNYTGFQNLALQKYPQLMTECAGVCSWSWGNAPGFPGQYVDKWLDKILAAQKR